MQRAENVAGLRSVVYLNVEVNSRKLYEKQIEKIEKIIILILKLRHIFSSVRLFSGKPQLVKP